MKKFLQILILGIMLTSCSAEESIPIRLEWQMGSNYTDKACYSSSFVIHNRSNQELDKNWKIGYNQLTREIFMSEDSPVKIERVNADYFEIIPTKNYIPIAAGDSLVVNFEATNGLIVESHIPSGAFFVAAKDGEEQTAQPLTIYSKPLSGDSQLNRVWASEPPYAFAERVYEKNASITPVERDQFDIIPSLKSVTKSEGEASFSTYKITSDPTFTQEAQALSNGIKRNNNIEADNNSNFTITLNSLSDKAQNSEYYNINITEANIILSANTQAGMFNATQTLLSIMRGQKDEVRLKCAEINDYPDLEHRGIMLDVARNFTHKDDLLTLIDVFSSYKINVVHLHLTDDEGWRLEIPGIEELTTVGAHRGYTRDENECLYPAYGSGISPTDTSSAGNGYYSREEFIDILKYAAERNISIICEVDFPGHARAAIKSMEARYNKYIDSDKAKATEYLLTDFDDKSEYRSAQGYTDNVINVGLESSYHFIDKVIGEISKMYAQAGVPLSTIHVGGDEVAHGSLVGSQLCVDLMQREGISNAHDLNSYFFNRASLIFAKHNISTSGWQELALGADKKRYPDFQDRIGNVYCWNTVPEWEGDRVPYELANAGYDVVLSNVTNLYFDLCYTKHRSERGLFWAGFTDEASSFNILPYSLYKSNRTNLKGEPVDIFANGKGKQLLEKEAHKHIKGIQGQLFAENSSTFEQHCYSLFPKMFGLSERAWNATPDFAEEESPKAENEKYSKALDLYYSKIFKHELPYISELGLNYRVNPAGAKKENGKLLVNNPNPDAKVYFTLDGSEPNESSTLWTAPIKINGSAIVKLKTYYLGNSSIVTETQP